MMMSSKKAQNTALLALIISVVFCIATLLLGGILKILIIYDLCWQILGTVLIWLVLYIQFYHRNQAEQEKLDMAQLAKTRENKTIFEESGSKLDLLAEAQQRLVFVEKWLIPIAGFTIAVFQILMGAMLIRKTTDSIQWELQNPLLGAILLAGISFVSLLISRYATGLSGQSSWRPLRAGGSQLLATAILGFASAIALAFAQYKYMIGVTILEWVIPILLVLLGTETILAGIFDIYRPRVPDQYSRTAFDSRLLGLINEPGGIFHTVASTLDYQFGFQVSQTWFYKLLEKAILPLVLFLVLTMYLLSCVAIVGPGQGAIIEHLGSARKEDGGREVGPGWHWKLPWPFEISYRYPTSQIQQIQIGYVETAEDMTKPLLWGQKHYQEEYNLLVAVETDSASAEQGTAPVSIVKGNVPVHYRIKDLYQYLYQHEDAGKMLEAICYRELARFAASAEIEIGDSSNPGKSLLGAGRIEASRELQRRIQSAAVREGLGIEIVFLGLQGVHPPPELAGDYQDVVAAVQRKQATILNARAEHAKKVTQLAGSIREVDALYDLVQQFSTAQKEKNIEKANALMDQMYTALRSVKGQVYSIIRSAESEAFGQVARARGEGMYFKGNIKAYQASPEIYQHLQRLAAIEQALEGIRKYVIVAEEADTQIYTVDLQEKLEQTLMDMDVKSVLQSSN